MVLHKIFDFKLLIVTLKVCDEILSYFNRLDPPQNFKLIYLIRYYAL